METKADLAFEVSWEVCNKVGGIYTVVKSKAAQMVSNYGENYFLVGPYFASKSLGEFSEELPKEFCKDALEELKNEGIICHFGKWLAEGSPNVILIDFEGFKSRINDIKKDLWESFKVDSLRSGNDYDEPVAWSYAVGKVIEKLNNCMGEKKLVAHFHEWLAGAGLLYLKKTSPDIGTVFTTHATILGRTLASSNIELYDSFENLDAEKEAYKYKIESKYHLEKQAALNSEVFTTVSEITAMEAEHLLGRKPDVLVLNGLDIDKFPTFEESAINHKLQRERIREFISYYFFPYYTFDIKETLTYFIVGRNEFRDKGLDVFIDSLGQLNKKLKEENSKKTIITFIWVPANIRNVKSDLLENKIRYQDIKDLFDELNDDLKKGIINLTLLEEPISEENLLEKKFIMEMESKVKRFKKEGVPEVCTHDLYEEDAVINALQEAGLKNEKEDKVKVIYYPIYLSGADGLLNLSYYESLQGSHLGIFPSYYEPWGYTPLESGALGVPSITTDLAGFGRFICKENLKKENPGIYVLKRLGKKYGEVVDQLTETMHTYSKLSRHDRITNKMRARKMSSTADWKLFVDNYIQAHNLAIEKINS
ncbi:glycogen/starch synthase [Candidatus Woesearchaeota archaeon]|nr:glycogen/starch synthase [Candidatus Woesearchaeota archaeon]